jgi:hypothetical protein
MEQRTHVARASDAGFEARVKKILFPNFSEATSPFGKKKLQFFFEEFFLSDIPRIKKTLNHAAEPKTRFSTASNRPGGLPSFAVVSTMTILPAARE